MLDCYLYEKMDMVLSDLEDTHYTLCYFVSDLELFLPEVVHFVAVPCVDLGALLYAISSVIVFRQI